ncbi:MAG: Gldg family protein [Archangium sp.]|nr:Gldg family protein [Archangium sp.]MDP3569051.1 Gldg family protein [Archangium sp.]
MKKTLGSVAGGIGLLLTITSVITFFVTSGSLVPFFVKLGLGVLLIAFWAITAGERAGTWARSAFFYSSSVGLGIAFIGVLFAANFIVAKRAPTWDLTAKKVFSLSAQTVNTLKDLKNPVQIIAFVEGETPPQVEELFKRYAAQSDQFTFEFKDPRKTPDLTMKYQIRQGQPAAVLISSQSHTMLNLQRLGSPLLAEQELTNGLIKLEKVGEQKLYFLAGHGEIPLDPVGEGEDAMMASLITLKRMLQDEGYAPTALNLIQGGEIPADASAVVIAGARNKISDNEQKILERYLEQGGRLIYFAEAQAEPELTSLLSKYGAQIEPGIVADSKVNPEQPYIVYSPFFGDHEITRLLQKGQQNVVFATSRAITQLKEGTLPDLTLAPLVLTTPYAWVETSMSENPTKDQEERTGQIVLALASTRPTIHAEQRRADEARVVIFGDSDLLTGTFGYEPNRNMVMNAFAWVTQQLQKITIRPPDRDISTVDLTNDKLGTIRLLAMDVFPTLLMAIGLTIWQARRAR